MMALDTNVVVRLLARDDPAQVAAAEAVVREGEVFFLTDVVVAEVVWVLRRAYGWGQTRVFQALQGLLSLSDLVFEDEEAVAAATEAYGDGGDWADHLILYKARRKGCQGIYSFDAMLRRIEPGFALEPRC